MSPRLTITVHASRSHPGTGIHPGTEIGGISLPRTATKPICIPELVEEDGHDDHVEERRREKSADRNDGEGRLNLLAWLPPIQREGNGRETRHKRRHEDGIEPFHRALHDGLAERDETGAWRHKLRRTDPSQSPDTAVWWVQGYGNMLRLYAHRTTGDPRYLEAFRKGAHFWTDAFVDREQGGTVLRTTLDGTVVDGDKAVRTKTSYHAAEHALLLALYLDLWTTDTPTTLHYRLDSVQDLSRPALRCCLRTAALNGWNCE